MMRPLAAEQATRACRALIAGLVLGLFLAPGIAAAQADTLYDLDGRPQRLETFLGRGKWTVVMVWASDCPVCAKEGPQMAAFHEAHRTRDAEVLGISVDGLARKPQILAFIAQHGVSFPSLVDDGKAFAAIYLRATGRPWFGGTPINLIYAPDGELAGKRIGPLPRADLEAFIEKMSRAKPVR